MQICIFLLLEMALQYCGAVQVYCKVLSEKYNRFIPSFVHWKFEYS